jgi:predicted dehydrogenase
MQDRTQHADDFLLGVGQAGRVRGNHLCVVQESERPPLLGIADSVLAITTKQVNGVPVSGRIDAAPVADDSAAVVAAPTETHVDVAGRRIALGKSMLLETPNVPTVAQRMGLTERARESTGVGPAGRG